MFPSSQSPRKQSGFTLIELMVVMAIIAILATAGLSAYTGYIKKARDTTRIADVAAINNIVMGMMSSTGMPPRTAAEVITAVTAANNGTMLKDPLLGNPTACYSGTTPTWCGYYYKVCDGGTGYSIMALFESKSNLGLYTLNESGPGGDYTNGYPSSAWDVGSCNVTCCNGVIYCPDRSPSCPSPMSFNYTNIAGS